MARHRKSEESQGTEKRSSLWTPLGMLREVVVVCLIAVVISAVIKAFFIQSFEIPSESMRETLEVGDKILVNKLVSDQDHLERGDVIVFRDSQDWLAQAGYYVNPDPSPLHKFLIIVGLRPDDSSGYLIKRLVGLPGDTVACCDADGRLTVNGVAVDETPYLRPGVDPSLTDFQVTVPEGHLWVMGDNRPNSADSRAHMDTPGQGFVPVDDVVGRAFVTIWPFNRWTTNLGTDAFDAVPPAK